MGGHVSIYLEMINNEDKLAIKAFYSDLFVQLTEISSTIERHKFLSSRSIGYLQLGDERGYLHPGDTIEDYIELKQINSASAPQQVVNSFDRHVWYSQHNLSDINVFKYDVNINVFKYDVKRQTTFAIYISGYVDDGWDNGCDLLEVYDVAGELLGSIVKGRGWKEQSLDRQDYFRFTPVYGSQCEPIWLQQNIRLV